MDEIEKLLNNKSEKYWKVRNGYVFSSQEALKSLKAKISTLNRDELVENVKIGFHYKVGVTDSQEVDAR